MKTKFFLTLTTVCLFLACSSGQSLTQTDSSKMETISLGYSIFREERNHYKIKVGQRMEYVFESNTSVGKHFACYVYSTEILKFVRRVLVKELKKDTLEFIETIDSTIPIRVDKSTTGSNRRIGKFVFEGIKEGTSTLVIDELFRFKVQQEMVFTITVEK